jgi:hypothetical protein
MSRTRTRLIAASAIAVLGLGLSGCGSDAKLEGATFCEKWSNLQVQLEDASFADGVALFEDLATVAPDDETKDAIADIVAIAEDNKDIEDPSELNAEDSETFGEAITVVGTAGAECEAGSGDEATEDTDSE